MNRGVATVPVNSSELQFGRAASPPARVYKALIPC
jgi:hypothetical protein